MNKDTSKEDGNILLKFLNEQDKNDDATLEETRKHYNEETDLRKNEDGLLLNDLILFVRNKEKQQEATIYLMNPYSKNRGMGHAGVRIINVCHSLGEHVDGWKFYENLDNYALAIGIKTKDEVEFLSDFIGDLTEDNLLDAIVSFDLAVVSVLNMVHLYDKKKFVR